MKEQRRQKYQIEKEIVKKERETEWEKSKKKRGWGDQEVSTVVGDIEKPKGKENSESSSMLTQVGGD